MDLARCYRNYIEKYFCEQLTVAYRYKLYRHRLLINFLLHRNSFKKIFLVSLIILHKNIYELGIKPAKEFAI